MIMDWGLKKGGVVVVHCRRRFRREPKLSVSKNTVKSDISVK
jgi:hypothetical protein